MKGLKENFGNVEIGEYNGRNKGTGFTFVPYNQNKYIRFLIWLQKGSENTNKQDLRFNEVDDFGWGFN